MIARLKPSMTEAEYLALERTSPTKHEYFAGDIFATTGASEQHNLIASNVTASLHRQLRGRDCRVYPSGMRLKIVHTGLNTYPDISVVRGQPQFTDVAKRDTLLNPTVIIEILSPSTERYNRGMRFQHYRTIESLQEYILISQDTARLERYTRYERNQWILAEAIGPTATLPLASISAALDLADVYELVDLPLTPSPELPRDIPSE